MLQNEKAVGLHFERFNLNLWEATLTKAYLVEEVELRGFGSFRFRGRGPRRARNPKTGEQVNVPARKVVYFKPAKSLKELINS